MPTSVPSPMVGTPPRVPASALPKEELSLHTVASSKSWAPITANGNDFNDKPVQVKRCLLIKLPYIATNASERSGYLTFLNYNEYLPFTPARHFIVTASDSQVKRGGHAHKATKMFIQCVSGCIAVSLDDGQHQHTVTLDANKPEGLLIGSKVWSVQTYIEANSTLLAVCSTEYDSEDYIHDYQQFLRLANGDLEENKGVQFLNVKAAAMLVDNEIQASFKRIVHSGRYCQGSEVLNFETQWAAFCGAEHCIGVGSGLAALHLLLTAANIGSGDEIIVPANTYIATVLAVTQCGATPVFVEPDETTRTINPQLIEAAISANTKAILSVDLYGMPVDYDAIGYIANRCNIYHFSDAAQSHGALYKGKIVGGLCHATAFSFYPSKNLGAIGEAGAVTTNDAPLADRIAMLRNYGSRQRYHNELKGLNERMDEVQAAILTAKMKHLVDLNARRKAIAQRYITELSDLEWLQLPCLSSGETGGVADESSWHLFVVTCEQRDLLQAHLANLKIDSMIHYRIPPHLSQAYADLKLGKGSFPIAERLADTCLSIPICPFLTNQNVQDVITGVRSFKRDNCLVF